MSGKFTGLAKFWTDVPLLDAGTGRQHARHACKDADQNG